MDSTPQVNEALQAVQWVLMPEPVEYAQETIGASDFWANKIRMQYKNTDGGAPQVAFCTALKALLTGLVAYIKANHAKGLTWNPSVRNSISMCKPKRWWEIIKAGKQEKKTNCVPKKKT